MFEVINNRGKSLSDLEKIKNYLIYFAEKNQTGDLKQTVKDKWPSILKRLNSIHFTSNEQENSFLRNCWLVYTWTTKKDSHHVYDSLKEKYPASEGKHFEALQKFVHFIDNAALTYCKLYSLNGVGGDEKVWLDRLRHHAALASVMPFIIAVNSRPEVTPAERVQLLESIEKLNFRYYGTNLANRSDSGQGDLFNLAHWFYLHLGETPAGWDQPVTVEWAKNEMYKFIKHRAPDIYFIQSLTLDQGENGDYYHWNSLKFFLASYEQELRSKQQESKALDSMLFKRASENYNDNFQKEHIWAGEENSLDKNVAKQEFNKRRLGNFVLLKEGLNKGLGKIRIEKKLKELRTRSFGTGLKPELLQVDEMQGVFDRIYNAHNSSGSRHVQSFWLRIYEEFLDVRETSLVNFALIRWQMGSENTEVKISSDTESKELYSIKEF
jgi:hypothetical protein